jgi:uncharacterized protein (DUF1810 family)
MVNNQLNRFLTAQEGSYQTALNEIKMGRKRSHWMWFIFPQIQGLGKSETAKFYAITDQAEAIAYLNHMILGSRLKEISAELLKLDTSDPIEVFGDIDSIKLKSAMTLFSSLPNTNRVFQQVLDKFFDGAKDGHTLQLLHT